MKKLLTGFGGLLLRYAVAIALTALFGSPAYPADWIVTGPEMAEGRTIVLAGNLTIESGGSLTLRNTSLTFDNSTAGQHGIRVKAGGALTIENNSLLTTVRDDAHMFFNVDESASLVMQDSDLRRCGGVSDGSFDENGLFIKGSATLQGNRFAENQQIILTSPGSGGTIIDNHFGSESILVVLFRSGLTISGNTFGPTTWFGISLFEADANIIRDNFFDHVSHGPVVFRKSWNNEFSRNRIIGGAGPYVMNQSGNTRIVDNTIDGIEGIFVNQSDNVTIMRNTLNHGGAWGIVLGYSSGCVIADNTISTTTNLYQSLAHVELMHASNNKIVNNRISSPRSEDPRAQRIGILLWGASSANLIRANEIDVPRRGISIHYGSDDNEVLENTVRPTMEQPVVVEQSSRNRIHHNNFLGGSRDPFDDTASNVWDDGSAGNYWKNYAGDGLAPYAIPPSATDKHPLPAPVVVQPPVTLSNPPLARVIRESQQLDVTGDTMIIGQTVGPYSSIIVRNGARLTISDSTVFVVGEQGGITVESGATLEVINSRIMPPSPERGGFHFAALPGSFLLIRKSEVRGVGSHPGCSDWASLYVLTGGAVIEDSLISDSVCGINLAGGGDRIAGNTVTMSQNCINGVSDSSFIDNVVERCLDIGLHGGDRTTMQRNKVSHVWGLAMSTGADSTVIGNTIAESEKGLMIYYRTIVMDNRIMDVASWALVGGWDTLVRRNLFQNNGGGVKSYGGSTTYCFNSFIRNAVYELPGGDRWDCDGRGNYWSDYHGIDADGDGIGDTPHMIEGSEWDNYPLMSSPFATRGRAVRH
jgi:parallel beta-helix repeat protein